MAKKAQRARYSPHVKDQVRKRYPLCRTTADKVALAKELEIVDEKGKPSISKLYNLASRLKAAGQDIEPGQHSEAHDPDRLEEREDPKEVKFSRQADRYLKNEFGRSPIEDIAYHLHHSETAVLYRARQLKLRQPVKYWRVDKVARWFGMEEDEFRKLEEEGLDIYPLTDAYGKVQVVVVSTSSLARWMAVEENKKRLEEQGADQFFMLEIEESIADLLARKTEFERCKFLSHGHVCMNPRSDFSYGLYCTNNEKYRAGEDPRCMVRVLQIEDITPDE